jgi:hypothetical protein
MMQSESKRAGGARGIPGWLPSKRILIAAVLVAEVAVLASVAFSATSGPSHGLVVREGAASLTMVDQRNVVGVVTVQRVVSPVDGWVIVQADWNEGVPDALLGSRWVPAGESHDITIGLDPRQPTPRRIFVTLLADRGKPDVLEFVPASRPGVADVLGIGADLGATAGTVTRDQPVVSGALLVSAHVDVVPLSFAVGPGQAFVAESTRTADADVVVIPRVVAPAQSWVAISLEATAGESGGVLGTKLVSAGDHRDVAVPLNVRLGPSPVIATLHVDLGRQGRFDFSPTDLGNSIDQPYVAGGRTVSAPVRFAR